MAVAQNAHGQAAKLLGAAEALRRTTGTSIYSADQDEYDRTAAAVRAALGKEAVAPAWEEGQTMPLEQVIAVALTEEGESQPGNAPPYPDGLTVREVDVLRLIAPGRSNRDIGNELFISLNTVARHVSNIFAKTGSANRAGAATYATRHGMVP